MSNAVEKFDDDSAPVEAASSGIFSNASNQIDTTFPVDTEEKQELVFNSLADSEPIANHLDEVFELKGAIAQKISVTDPDTGEVSNPVSIIFITGDDKLYRAVSGGVARDVARLFNSFGFPETWKTPRYVKVTEVKVGKNRVYNLRLASAPNK